MLVYSVLQSKLVHPRQLSIALREQLIKDGLGDREPAVRLAAGKLVGSWFDKVVGEVNIPEGETWKGDDGGIMRGFVTFLALFDVVGPGEAIAVDAMLSIFVTRPELMDAFEFQDDFWKELTPESAVLARAFVEHFDNDARLEAAALPVVTAFAFHIQEAYNTLLEILDEEADARFLHREEGEDEEEAGKRDEELAKREVILAELLRISLKLDYMDEIGRRKVFSVVKEMLSHPELPSSLIERCLDILKVILPDERELIRVIVEIIIELREDDHVTENDNEASRDEDSRSDAGKTTFKRDKSLQRKKGYHDMTAEERAAADITDLRCLMICIALLERVHGNFEDNSTLEGVLADLIIPSVKRKEFALREKGLVSLGLCCLIAKNMALSSFQLFLNQLQSAPADMKTRVLQIIFDLLTTYSKDFFGRADDIAQRIIDYLLEVFQTEVSDSVLATMAIGLSKLLLAGSITDSTVLSILALSYVNFETRDNQELRQCLSYFFPVYCYSSLANQSRMRSVFMQAFDLFVRLHEESDANEDMITPHQFGLLMLDWTNSQKAANVIGGVVGLNVHADLAIDILKALYEDRSANDKKVLVQLLGSLDIAHPVEERTLFKLHLLLSYLDQQCPLDDVALDRLFGRFKSRIFKLFGQDFEKLHASQFLSDEIHELYQYIGIDFPDQESYVTPSMEETQEAQDVEKDVNDPSNEPPARARSKRHKSESVVQDDNVSGDHIEHDNSPRRTDDSDSDSDSRSPLASKPINSKTARMPNNAPQSTRNTKASEDAEDDDDRDVDSDARETSAVLAARPGRKGVKRNQASGPGGLQSPSKKRSRLHASGKRRNPVQSSKIALGHTAGDQLGHETPDDRSTDNDS
ncbi:hypothetical protein AX17_004671 [Amanita inopinata Kibby_2008]|nr:hypothetical protein AX17_004671 [Amanita inopinata Kibby_2008]